MAFRCEIVRPVIRAALRLTTAGPLSTAVQVASGNNTRLPNGIRFGSTAQCPARSREQRFFARKSRSGEQKSEANRC